jgi:hypothetical protein
MSERCALRPGNVHSADGWRAVLEPVITRYRGTAKSLYFRGDAAFANPEMYEFLEAAGIGYTIRLPANKVLQNRIGYLPKRPVGRTARGAPNYSSFSYQAKSWNKLRRVVAKVEWHPGELYPRVGFVVTNLVRPAGRRRLLQPARHGRAMDQGRKGRGQMDPAVMPILCCQRCPPSAPRPRLQPGQFHADAGDAQHGGGMVADQPAREANQDRREGCQPQPLRHVPDGRGRGIAADVRLYPVADRPAPGTTRASMTGRSGRYDRR